MRQDLLLRSIAHGRDAHATWFLLLLLLLVHDALANWYREHVAELIAAGGAVSGIGV